MGTIIKTIHSLRVCLKRLKQMAFVAGLAAAGCLTALALHAQVLPAGVGQATDFSSVEYYDPPFEQQMKSRVSGAESRPVPGTEGVLDVKQLRIENFSTNGQLEAVISAPQCFYSTADYTAQSAGAIRVESGDGKSTLTGDGFLWRQNEKLLTISNHVTTVISDAVLPAGTKP